MMTRMTEKNLLKEVSSHAKEVKEKMPKGYTHFVTMLYGSQNYNLATETSDVDTKTMVIPTLEDVVLNKKMLSTDYIMADDSLDNCKDYRAMFENYMKGNINFVETLFTKYYVVNEPYIQFWNILQENRDLIANAQPSRLVHMIGGMAIQKYKAMEHPFESKIELLNKYGYDPKQLHHIVRLRVFAETYLDTKDFKSCLVPNDNVIEYIKNVKTTPIPLEDARELANKEMAKIDDLIVKADNKFLNENKNENKTEEVKQLFDELTINIFTTCVVK